MVLKDLQICYTKCAHCGSSSCISSYQPRTVASLEALCRAAYKVCTRCGSKLSIQEIKAEIVEAK